jgi:hypothetical protein
MLGLDAMSADVTVEQWIGLAWSFLDTDEGIRRRLLTSLATVIQTHGVHLRFLCYPCLFAVDDKLANQAEQILRFAVGRLRKTHEQIYMRAFSEEDESARILAEAIMPETMLPYLLYLLSYHPHFPSSARIETEEDERRIEGIVRHLKMVLRVLFDTLSSETDNLPFLLKQVNTISQRCRDRHDSGNIGLHFLSRLTLKMLNENIRTSDNTQNLSAPIRLPDDLFEYVEDVKGRNKGLPESDIMKGIQKSERFVEKGSRAQKSKLSPPGRMSSAQAASSRAKQRGDKQKPRAKRVRDDDSDQEGDDDDDAVAAPIHAPVPGRPQRSTRANVSYTEKAESTKEMLKWERAVAKQQERRSQGSTQSSYVDSSWSPMPRTSAGGSQRHPRHSQESVTSSVASFFKSRTSPAQAATSSRNTASRNAEEVTAPKRKTKTRGLRDAGNVEQISDGEDDDESESSRSVKSLPKHKQVSAMNPAQRASKRSKITI